METKQRKEFAGLLFAVGEIFGKEISELAIGLWWEILKKYPMESVRGAINQAAQGKFMPRPGDVVELLEGSVSDRAVLAWQEVLNGIKSIGPYESVEFADPVSSRCVLEMGGWVKVCEITNEELPFRQKDFERLYRAYSQRPELIEAGRPHPGIFEITNASGKIEKGVVPGVELKTIGTGVNRRLGLNPPIKLPDVAQESPEGLISSQPPRKSENAPKALIGGFNGGSGNNGKGAGITANKNNGISQNTPHLSAGSEKT